MNFFTDIRVRLLRIRFASKNEQLAASAVQRLGKLKGAKVLSILIDALNHKSFAVRAAAVRALDRRWDEGASIPLQSLLSCLEQWPCNDKWQDDVSFGRLIRLITFADRYQCTEHLCRAIHRCYSDDICGALIMLDDNRTHSMLLQTGGVERISSELEDLLNHLGPPFELGVETPSDPCEFERLVSQAQTRDWSNDNKECNVAMISLLTRCGAHLSEKDLRKAAHLSDSIEGHALYTSGGMDRYELVSTANTFGTVNFLARRILVHRRLLKSPFLEAPHSPYLSSVSEIPI